jgi:hypothetical protein
LAPSQGFATEKGRVTLRRRAEHLEELRREKSFDGKGCATN